LWSNGRSGPKGCRYKKRKPLRDLKETGICLTIKKMAKRSKEGGGGGKNRKRTPIRNTGRKKIKSWAGKKGKILQETGNWVNLE